MKKFNLALLICLIFGITSCGEEEVLTTQNEKQPFSVANDSAFFRSEADAVFSAINAISKAYPNDKRISLSKKSLTVKSVKSLKSDNNQSISSPGFYIINFEGGGFAMISNDTRATEVYAYSDEGALYPGVNDNVDYYMSLANNYINYEIASSDRVITGLPITPTPSDPDDPRNYVLVYHGEHYCHEVPVNETNYGSNDYLLNTEWGQGSPYNNLCLTSDGKPVSAGCVAIALAQIMAFHKKPLSYNGHTYLWDIITQYPIVMPGSYGAQSVAELVHDIGVEAGINYLAGDSGTSNSGACNALSVFGYNRTLADYSYQIITNNINAGRPCYASGFNNSVGHAWVIDGYKSTSTTYKYYMQSTLELCSTNTETTSYVHCNWGWSGNCNGFFLNGVFNSDGVLNYDNTTNSNISFGYPNNLKIIYNIYQ